MKMQNNKRCKYEKGVLGCIYTYLCCWHGDSSEKEILVSSPEKQIEDADEIPEDNQNNENDKIMEMIIMKTMKI